MNPQESPGLQEEPGPQENPAIPVGPASRSRLAPGRRRARLIIAAAAIAGGLLATSAVVNAVVAPGSGSASAGQQASAAEATPEPALTANPTPSATQAAKAAPVKAAAAKAPAKATAVKAPAVVRKAAPAPAKAPAANTYTVVAGDTVGSIAARFGVDVNSMLAANGLGPYSVIVPGQTLKLSGPAVAVPKAAAAPAPATVQAPAPAPAPAVRTIYVAGAGGQALVDSCIGPIHFTPTDGYSLFITEHDFCGGWARFSGIGVGERVDIPGYGSYTVAARSQVPNPGTTNDVAAVFGGFPRAVLQTCIPGTSQMLVIALN
ncbi:LysM domain-containing protein [Arthrobacter sp. ISL-5]|uniref:LysM peptidoglycan-binding domain-containing protein n=1 Tax=Arthrobacter sp. ISL-5 TaxID=2819111 RepID=UPI001BEB0CE4|nr:LysM domain-containing protein [Arthrobacter sp. ISL-5]MBT2552491.1 LysM peptidoglycan-binding domain-containing protein [Arthrobacter sp. ISL-5]